MSPGSGGKGQSKEQSTSPGKSGGSSAQSQSEPSSKGNQGSAQQQSEPKGGVTKGTARQGKDGTDKAAESKRDDQKGKAAQGSKDQAPTKDQAQSKDQAKEKSPRAESKDKADTKTTTKTGAPKSDDTATDSKRTPDQKSAGGGSGAAERVQLSEQQRTSVRETIMRERPQKVTNVNFSLSIGTRVPRSTRLHVLPATVISVVPEYRSYRYILVEDEIVIVDPDSYAIIAIVDERGGPGRRAAMTTARLTLAPPQRAILLEHIDVRGEATLGIGGISIGTKLPEKVRVQAFPQVIVDRVPEVRAYRYAVIEHDIAIVDPSDSTVVLIVEAPN